MRTFLLAFLLLSACRSSDKDAVETGTVDSQADTSTESGLDDTAVQVGRADEDGDGFDVDDDCDDNNAAVNPDAEEVCDGIDNDCDEEVDEEDAAPATWYADGDGDGYGDDSTATESCDALSGHVLESGDCNDTDPDMHPNAPETDCTDPTDYNCDGAVGFADDDDDGFAACEDCDDNDENINDDGVEICDGLDNDCDGDIDDADSYVENTTTWYGDLDGDNFGSVQSQVEACSQPTGFVANATDCNDFNGASYPGAAEICDEEDNNCDGTIDEGVTSTFYADGDGDGYGDAASTTAACSLPGGYSVLPTDCDDADPSAHPGAFEICDGVDNDCDSTIDENAINAQTFYADTDSDTYGDATSTTSACTAPSGFVSNATDCDDSTSAVNPGATETCNGIDDNCVGGVDEGVTTTFFADTDTDTYGDATSTTSACTAPSGFVSNATDCDDSTSAVNPGATETCNGIDDDCVGGADNGLEGSEATCAAENCEAILTARPSATNGTYYVDPDNSGSAIALSCEMTIEGGGWTQATDAYVSRLSGGVDRRYLYSRGSAFYLSPVTQLVWTWNSYQALNGTYEYATSGTTATSSFGCSSGEGGHFGVGCSNGGGAQWKVLPIYNSNASNGTCTICQDQPDAFGVGACASNVQIWAR